MIVTNKRKEILKKVISKYDEEAKQRKSKNKNTDEEFKKYREAIRKVFKRSL